MPPASKKLKGHIGLGLSVRPCIIVSVTLCKRSRTVRDRFLTLIYGMCMKKIEDPYFFFFFFFSVGLVVAELCPFIDPFSTFPL